MVTMGSETESDVEVVVVVVELQVVEKDKLNRWSGLNWWWSRSWRLLVQIPRLGSCPQMPAYWTPRCFSSVVSISSALKHALGAGGVDWVATGVGGSVLELEIGLMWMECGLMKWKKLLKVLDMRLSLYSQLLMQHVILLSEGR